MKNITCDNCGKDSGVEASESFGRDAAQAQHFAGFIPKMLTLYTGFDDKFICCCEECAKAQQAKIFAARSVSPEKIEKVRQIHAESKKRLSQMFPA